MNIKLTTCEDTLWVAIGNKKWTYDTIKSTYNAYCEQFNRYVDAMNVMWTEFDDGIKDAMYLVDAKLSARTDAMKPVVDTLDKLVHDIKSHDKRINIFLINFKPADYTDEEIKVIDDAVECFFAIQEKG